MAATVLSSLPSVGVLSNRPAAKPQAAHRSGNDHDFPGQRSGFLQRVLLEKSMRRGGFGERERLADHGLQLLRDEPLIDFIGTNPLLVGTGIEYRKAVQR